jgi:hypothetical protein
MAHFSPESRRPTPLFTSSEMRRVRLCKDEGVDLRRPSLLLLVQNAQSVRSAAAPLRGPMRLIL